MNYIQNAINALSPWWTATTMLAYVLGVCLFLYSANSALKSQREPRSNSYFWTFLVSVLLLNLPAMMDSISLTLFQAQSLKELSYTSSAPNAGEYITFSIRAVMLIGLISLGRGFNYLRDTPQRAKDTPKALSHIISGTLAVNIVQFFRAIGASLGGDIESYINIIL